MSLGDASVGDAYTLGVQVTGDLASLRQELAQSTSLIAQFANTSVDAMNRAAGAINTAATAIEQQASRTTKSNQQTQQSNEKTSTSFEDYMRRATAAEKQVADSTTTTSQRTTAGLSSVGSVLGRLTGVAGFALLAKQVWDTGIGFNTFVQNTQISLTTLLGSQEAAKGFLADILAFAKQTPYAFTDLTNQAQRLLSYGIDAKNIIPVLTAVGDAATGMGKGKEGIDQLNTALGQIQAKGRLQSDELLQLSEVGVNGLKILANQANMTTADYSKLVQNGLIPADTAIKGLVDGIEHGTNGVNGQTAAFDGLMSKIKGSGGITATMDSTRTAFRNAAGAVTDSLVPAYLTFLHTAQQGLHVVQDTAKSFGSLPQPVQSSALALVAATVAVKAFNVQGRAEGVWASFSETINASKASAQAMGQEIGTVRAGLLATRAAAPGVGSALLGAFGGPVGLAITGITVAITAFATAQAQARARVDELSATLDEQGRVTDDTAKKVSESLSQIQSHGPFGILGKDSQSAFDAASKLGVDLQTVKDAALGSADALEKVKAATQYSSGALNDTDPQVVRAKQLGISTNEYLDAAQTLQKAVRGQNKDLDAAIRIAKQKAEADGTAAQAQYQVGHAYVDASYAVRQFTDDQAKAQQAADDAATSAFNSAVALSSMKLDLSTASDVADARDKVKDATNGVRDAEASLQEVRDRKKHTANDVAKAEDAVTEARKKAKEAADSLADTEARRDPVAQYKKQQAQILADAKAFRDNIRKLGEEGLNATDLLTLINQGPEASKDTISALLKDKSLVGQTNKNRTKLDSYAADLGDYATAAQTALQVPGAASGKAFADAFKLAINTGAADTIQSLADKLGLNPRDIYNIGLNWGNTLVTGMKDAYQYADIVSNGNTFNGQQVFSTNHGMGGRQAFAAGGVLPGYTPGRDVYAFATPLGRIDLSGGEAVMRPEFTRAVGPGWVHSMNAAARSGGVAGVAAAMDRYLGGFAGGGLVPQVVTVPQSVTNTREEPQSFYGNIYVSDPESVRPWASRARARRNLTGRR